MFTGSWLDESTGLWHGYAAVNIRFFLFLVLWSIVVATAAAQTDRVVSFRNGPKLAITVPMGYSFDSKNNSDGSVTMRMENPVWNIRIDALVAVDPDPVITTREWQQSKVIEHMAMAMSRAREDDYVFKPLAPIKGTGIFCAFSAMGAEQAGAADPGEFTWVTGGVKTWPKCVVLFRVFSTEIKSPEYLEALELFNWSFTE